jgi:hypothetical protein
MTDYTHLIARLRLSQTGGIHYEAADALEAQARRIAELEAELACSIVSGNDARERALGYVYELNDAAEMLANQARTLKEWHERIVELKSALKPFVDEAQFYHPMFKDEELAAENTFDFTIGDLRAARAAYLGEKE